VEDHRGVAFAAERARRVADIWLSPPRQVSLVAGCIRCDQSLTRPLMCTVIASFDLAIVPVKLRPEPWVWA
jgi:hypothetical protein